MCAWKHLLAWLPQLGTLFSFHFSTICNVVSTCIGTCHKTSTSSLRSLRHFPFSLKSSRVLQDPTFLDVTVETATSVPPLSAVWVPGSLSQNRSGEIVFKPFLRSLPGQEIAAPKRLLNCSTGSLHVLVTNLGTEGILLHRGERLCVTTLLEPCNGVATTMQIPLDSPITANTVPSK